MATILRLPYTMAIAPYSRGGLLYGLPHCCAVSAATHGFQCVESTSHSSVPGAPRGPTVYGRDPRGGRQYTQRAVPPAPGSTLQGADRGPHADNGPGYC